MRVEAAVSTLGLVKLLAAAGVEGVAVSAG